MRKFPYIIDVIYASGRTEAVKVRNSQEQARSEASLKHMKFNGLVTDFKRRVEQKERA